jgi:hypothetical protein
MHKNMPDKTKKAGQGKRSWAALLAARQRQYES